MKLSLNISEYLLNASYMPDTVLYSAVNKIDKAPFFTKLSFFLEMRDSKTTHKYIICQVWGLRRPGSSMQKFERRDKASPERFLGRGNRRCKGKKATMWLAC